MNGPVFLVIGWLLMGLGAWVVNNEGTKNFWSDPRNKMWHDIGMFPVFLGLGPMAWFVTEWPPRDRPLT